jgi:TetR/AcrR family transcriptional repressor of nem operon
MSSKVAIQSQPKSRRGRPSVFDPLQALEDAMRLFWKNGYEGTSIDQLCRVTRMPRASLYQRHGGKEGLFLAALQHYVQVRVGPVLAALGPRGTLEQDLTQFFDAIVALATQDDPARGCLIACVLADAAGTNPRFRDELEARFAVLEDRLAARIRLAPPEGLEIESPEVHALLLASVARGIMVRARSGAPTIDLRRVGRAAAKVGQVPSAICILPMFG